MLVYQNQSGFDRAKYEEYKQKYKREGMENIAFYDPDFVDIYDKKFYGFTLIGKGESGKDCGELLPLYSCSDCFKLHFVRKKCMQKSCPNCWEDWVKSTTPKIAIRLLSDKARELNDGRRLVHIILSPGEEIVKAFEKRKISYEDMRDEAENYLSDKTDGQYAGVLVFHAFRPSTRYWEERGEQRKDDDDPENDKKKWEWIRSKKNWYDYVEFSPHWHFIGWVGWIDKPVKNEEFVYKMITTGGRVARFDTGKKKAGELFKLVYYVLTHTCTTKIDYSDTDEFHSYVWLGNMAGCSFGGVPDELTAYNEEMARKKGVGKGDKCKCKDCGGKLYYMRKNLDFFFKVYCNIAYPSAHSLNDLRGVVLNSTASNRIKMNVLECMKAVELGELFIKTVGPPPDAYIVEA